VHGNTVFEIEQFEAQSIQLGRVRDVDIGEQANLDSEVSAFGSMFGPEKLAELREKAKD
jgi:hypothetical protein